MPYFITRDGIVTAMNIDELTLYVQAPFLKAPRNNMLFEDLVTMKKIANAKEESASLGMAERHRIDLCMTAHDLVDLKEELTEEGHRFVAQLDKDIQEIFGDEVTWENILLLKRVLDGKAASIIEKDKESLEYWIDRGAIQSFGNSEYRNDFIKNIEELDFDKGAAWRVSNIGIFGEPEKISVILDLYQKVALKKAYAIKDLEQAILLLDENFSNRGLFSQQEVLYRHWKNRMLSAEEKGSSREEMEKLFLEAFRRGPFTSEDPAQVRMELMSEFSPDRSREAVRDLALAFSPLGEEDERLLGLSVSPMRSGISSFLDFFQEDPVSGKIKENIFDLVDDPDVGSGLLEFSVSIEEDFDDFIKEQKKRKEGDSDPEFKGFL